MLAGASDGAACGEITRSQREVLPKFHRQKRPLWTENAEGASRRPRFSLVLAERRLGVRAPIGRGLRLGRGVVGRRWRRFLLGEEQLGDRGALVHGLLRLGGLELRGLHRRELVLGR